MFVAKSVNHRMRAMRRLRLAHDVDLVILCRSRSWADDRCVVAARQRSADERDTCSPHPDSTRVALRRLPVEHKIEASKDEGAPCPADPLRRTDPARGCG